MTDKPSTDTKETHPCDCECHIPGEHVMHCVPCCNFTYQKDPTRERHPYQETIDFVSRLM